MSYRRNGSVPFFFRVRTGTRSHVVYSLFCLLLAGVVSACGSSPTESQRQTIASKSYTAIQNPNNPFNSYGVLHNEGLDYIADNASSTDPSEMELELLLSEYLADVGVGYLNGLGDTVWYSPQFVLDSIVQAYDFWDSAGAGEWEGSVSFSPEQQAFIDAILGEAETIEAPISAGKRDSSMAVFDQIEDSILSSSALVGDKKNVPLALVAVAKHSLEYWSDYPEYYDTWFEEGGLGKMTDRKKVKKVVFEDAKGLIVGAFTGFLGGLVKGALGGVLVGGPAGGAGGAAAGAVGGSIAGAVTGAVGFSVAEGIRK